MTLFPLERTRPWKDFWGRCIFRAEWSLRGSFLAFPSSSHFLGEMGAQLSAQQYKNQVWENSSVRDRGCRRLKNPPIMDEN